MAWTTPATATAGSTALTAAFWNEQVRDNLANLRGLVNVQTAFLGSPFTLSSVATDTFYDATGLSVNITPTAATSKILVSVNLSLTLAGGADARIYFRTMRDATAVGVGDAAGNRNRSNKNLYIGTLSQEHNVCWSFVDSPATTSQITYKVQYAKGATALTAYLNRTGGDSDLIGQARSSSAIIVQEIPA